MVQGHLFKKQKVSDTHYKSRHLTPNAVNVTLLNISPPVMAICGLILCYALCPVVNI